MVVQTSQSGAQWPPRVSRTSSSFAWHGNPPQAGKASFRVFLLRTHGSIALLLQGTSCWGTSSQMGRHRRSCQWW